MHFLLATVGSHGDVHPFVGLGLVLRKHGHRVTLITSGHFRGLAEQAGLEFADSTPGEDFVAVLQDPDLWNKFKGFKIVMTRGVLPQLPIMYQEIAQRYVPGETVVVGSSLAFGARLAHEKLGAPLATVHLAPSLFRSNLDGPQLPGMFLSRGVPTWLKRFQYWLVDKVIIGRTLGGPLNEYRATLGLPPVDRPMDEWWHSPQLVLGMFPAWFGDPQPDWPPQLRMTGFPLFDERGLVEPSADVQQFLAAGEPPIAFTPGSANVHGREFFTAAAEACRRIGRRGMLLTRFPEQLPAPLPDGVRHFDFVPFGWLLPRVAAVVHHGGMGSTSQGLAAGVPQLIMPMGFDQFDNAARLEKLGVGATLPPKQFQATQVAEALRRLTTDATVAKKARAIADRMQGHDGLEEARHELEELAAISRGLYPGTASLTQPIAKFK